MSRNESPPETPPDARRYQGTSVLEIYQEMDGSWGVTQDGLDIVGTGESVPRATEDFARQLAEAKESGEL